MKKLFFGVGVVGILAILAFIVISGQQGTEKALDMIKIRPAAKPLFSTSIRNSGPQAFGSLAVTGSSGSTMLAGGAGNAEGAKDTPSAIGRGGGGGVDAKMMPPSEMTVVRYVYKGEPIDLASGTLPVYKRIKNASDTKVLAGTIKNMKTGLVDLSILSEPRIDNISLSDDQELGYTFNFDFNESVLNIFQNWRKWRIPERDACRDDACMRKFRPQLSDMPSNDEAVSLATAFLDNLKVDRTDFGNAIVDDNWKKEYERSSDKTNFYIPEAISIIFPLRIYGNTVRDSGGGYYGLFVSYDVMRKKISGLSNLRPNNYESSDYQVEQDFTKITKAAEQGGIYPMYYGTPSKVEEVELGKPDLEYMVYYHFDSPGAENQELYVPAAVFPVLEESSSTRYLPKYIVVPIVADILNQVKEDQNGPIMPMVKDAGSAGVSEGGAPGSTEPVTIK